MTHIFHPEKYIQIQTVVKREEKKIQDGHFQEKDLVFQTVPVRH